jgi:hypothetical protein
MHHPMAISKIPLPAFLSLPCHPLPVLLCSPLHSFALNALLLQHFTSLTPYLAFYCHFINATQGVSREATRSSRKCHRLCCTVHSDSTSALYHIPSIYFVLFGHSFVFKNHQHEAKCVLCEEGNDLEIVKIKHLKVHGCYSNMKATLFRNLCLVTRLRLKNNNKGRNKLK